MSDEQPDDQACAVFPVMNTHDGWSARWVRRCGRLSCGRFGNAGGVGFGGGIRGRLPSQRRAHALKRIEARRCAGMRRLVQRLAGYSGRSGEFGHATGAGNGFQCLRQSRRIVFFHHNRKVFGDGLIVFQIFGDIEFGQVGDMDFLGHGSVL